jgi:hypothetical protein
MTIGGWMLDKLLALMWLLWPVMLTFFLVALGILAFFIVFKAGTMAAFQRWFGIAAPVNKPPQKNGESSWALKAIR